MRKLLVSSALIVACGCSKQAPAPNSAASVAASPAQSVGASPLASALAAPHRKPAHVQRDVYRHPAETLTFFGVTPTAHVVELWPGGAGWYTEILAPLLREQGKLTAVAPAGNYLQPFKDVLASQPAVYDRVQLVEAVPPGPFSFGPDGSADVVLTFRNLHGWVSNGYAKQVLEAAYKVLKPGGVFGIVEHRAQPGVSAEESAKTGYISEQAAIELASAAGLLLEERSEINANPKDTKDYPNGVWSLPPTLKGGEQDKEKFVAIGESDRMTLRFRKPAQ